MHQIRKWCLLAAALTAAGAIQSPLHARVWYITVDGTGDAPTIQAAIDSAAAGDEIVVAPGRYTWANQGGHEFGLLFFARDVGGFTLRSEAGPEFTILDAKHRNRVAFVQGFNNVIIDGFTIMNGEAPPPDYIGGGICVHMAQDDIIRNCIFLDNSAEIGAGFWATSKCNTRVEGCTFTGNHARRFSAGIGVGYSQDQVVIDGCTVVGNSADEYGAGMIALRSTVLVKNSVFAGNTAGISGGGLYAFDTEAATFRNVTFSENSAPAGGGVYIAGISNLTLTRSIVAFTQDGTGLAVDPSAAVRLRCSDLYGNSGGDDWPEWVVDLGGNFSADPLFCGTPGSWEYTLYSNSPCLPGMHPSDFNCDLIGAQGTGCSGVDARPATWGQVKVRYGSGK